MIHDKESKSKKTKKSREKGGLHGALDVDIKKSGFNIKTEAGINFNKLFE